MNLTGEFHQNSSEGDPVCIYCEMYAYRVYFYIPLKPETVKQFVQAYIDNVYVKFGVSIWVCQIMALSWRTY